MSFVKSVSVLIIMLSIVFTQSSFALSIDRSSKFVIRKNPTDWNKDQNTILHWRFLTQARRYDRVTDASAIFNTTFNGVFQYKFYDELRFYGAFSAVFQTGNAQSRFGDLSPRTGLFVSDSYFLISPFNSSSSDFFTIELGALSQGRTINNNVLISGNSFPGVSEVLRFKTNDFSFVLRAQQLIPYSQVENADLSEREPTPTFLTESLKLVWDTENLRASATGGFYSYSKLPSTVADQSRVLGNSVIGDRINADFEYDFKGWFANFNFNTFLSPTLFFKFKALLVENLEAPERLNRGHDFSASLLYMNTKFWIGPYGGVFSLEPDVSPAFYNASVFGNNNRDGWYAGLNIFLREPTRMKLKLEYVDAKLLNPGALQENQKSIVLTLQTHFEQLGATL